MNTDTESETNVVVDVNNTKNKQGLALIMPGRYCCGYVFGGKRPKTIFQ